MAWKYRRHHNEWVNTRSGEVSKEVPAALLEDDSVDNSPPEPVSTDEIISGAPYEHRAASVSLDVVTTGVADPNAIPDPSDIGPVEVSVKVRPKAKRNKDIEIEVDEDDAGSSIIRVVSKSASGASSHISSDSDTDNNGDGDDDGDSDAPTSAEMKNRRDVHIGRNINSEVNAGLG